MNYEQFLNYSLVEVLRSKEHWVYPRLIKHLWSGDPSREAVLRLRLVQMLDHYGYRIQAQRQRSKLAIRYGVYIGPRTQIGLDIRLPHPTSIVIGSGLAIGERCRLYQQVTLSAAPKGGPELLSRLGNDVTIYPGAKFVGKGRVGNNVTVGANAVVNRIFGNNVILAGAPARVVRYLEDEESIS